MDLIAKINNAKSIYQILPILTVKNLETILDIAADSYYNTGQTLITDAAYDILIDRLRMLSPKSKIFSKTGADVKGKKVKLPVWMGSMNKIKTEEKLIDKWTSTFKGPYNISDKLDGISCLLTYKPSGTFNMYTRGNGEHGQDISHLLKLVNMSVDDFQSDTKVVIRGELIMPKETFKKYSKKMSNARNMVAGVVNSKKESVNVTYARDVDFVTYEIVEPADLKPSAQLSMLKKWGLLTVYSDIYNDIDLKILDNALQSRKKKSIYEIDGLIIADNKPHKRNLSGNPEYAFAYKGLTETAETKVIEVLWKPSKDGVIVPRIHFKKVRLSQADLEYTTGFNAKYIWDNNIGPGAVITIVRSGDVIPYIMNVVKPAAKPQMPNENYTWDKNEVNIILDDADDNETVKIQRLTKFARYIDVENLSEGLITKLVKAGYDTIAKLITLTVDDLLSLEGFQKTLATKIYQNLQVALQNVNMLVLMAASNEFGRGFGERKIKKILDVYPNIVNEYTKKTRSKWEDKLLLLEGFDTITVDHFLDAMPDFQDFYEEVSDLIDIKLYKSVVKTDGMFSGQTVVFTGFRNKDWQKFIESENGKVSGSVSKNTTLLVYNDGEESSAKYIGAKKLGIKTMTKTEFGKKYKV